MTGAKVDPTDALVCGLSAHQPCRDRREVLTLNPTWRFMDRKQGYKILTALFGALISGPHLEFPHEQ